MKWGCIYSDVCEEKVSPPGWKTKRNQKNYRKSEKKKTTKKTVKVPETQSGRMDHTDEWAVEKQRITLQARTQETWPKITTKPRN